MRKCKSTYIYQKIIKTSIVLIAVVICVLCLNNCTEKKNNIDSNDERDNSVALYFSEKYYPEYNVFFSANGKGYEIKNENSNKLIIILGGGPVWHSAIGRPGEKPDGSRFIDLVLPLNIEYNLFIPERFNWEVGLYYLYSVNARERYTVDNLLINYMEVIDEYLLLNDYDFIAVIGSSEGAMIFPELYFNLAEFEKINAFISLSYGGLSRFEQYETAYNKILSKEKPFILPDNEASNVMEEIKLLLSEYREEPYPDSTERIDEITERWHSSMMFRRPFDYYKNMEIPILFIHGEMDWNVPVESTKYVEVNLPDKPFDFIYYPEMEHRHTVSELLITLKDMSDWLLKVDP